MQRRGWAVLATAIVLSASAATAQDGAAPRCRSAGVGADSFCQVGGARLHFIDWGGSGPPLLLLAGFGATAHTFDTLAPRLAAHRRVIALTRRGFGQSEQTPSAYAAARFTADVVELMDALGVAQADVVGHSAAGAEMVRLAVERPRRVRRLVYLDAAYDFSEAMALQAGDPLDRRTPPPGSIAAYARLREATVGVRSPAIEADARQAFRVEGDRLTPVTSDAQAAQIAAALLPGKPDFAAVGAPSLAIYAPKDQPEQIPPTASAEQRQASLRYGLRHIRPWMLRAQADFLETAPCGVALERPGATHLFYLTDPAWTARTVLSFLRSEEPCRWRPD